ncbi:MULTISPECIES: hypothetical protein [unclassified Rhizobium]|nr:MULTISPECIES: hypothetical protein [unclassified Rhizobium]
MTNILSGTVSGAKLQLSVVKMVCQLPDKVSLNRLLVAGLPQGRKKALRI